MDDMKKLKEDTRLRGEKEDEQKKTNAVKAAELKAKIALEMERIRGLMAKKKGTEKKKNEAEEKNQTETMLRKKIVTPETSNVKAYKSKFGI